MIALTNKAAKRFKASFGKLKNVERGAWVVDLLKMGKGPLIVLIVHQASPELGPGDPETRAIRRA